MSFLKRPIKLLNDHIASLRAYLLSIRRSYLSTAQPIHRPGNTSRNNARNPTSHSTSSGPLSNTDKDSIDATCKTLLRDSSASLTQLASAESVRKETSARKVRNKYDKGVLGRWAAGGGVGGAQKSPEQMVAEAELETLKLFRESVLWFLGRKLEDVGEVQREMMERRLERELERGRSVLYKTKGGGVNGHVPGGVRGRKGFPGGQGVKLDDEGRREIEQQLSAEQLQLFASENQDMLKQYEDQLDQVRTAERSMLEISELQTQLVQNLDIQSANISQLVADSISTTENVGGGNKQLKKASERKSTARMVFWASCGLCGFLITWDLIF
ncbi:MAG: hypothetical protein OHK93_008127 [Ramalina farinacea]|uniref:t-SNARE coiled-coil homology domain-containing protein n=1 Tax=Ramalina farinacea TaxID=258253 RepID=A0AA43TRM2_9LECA|nr:hypothetical protein [Ramalina farinacea]